MAWLWMFLPLAVLLGAGALWRASQALAEEAHRLQAAVDALVPLTAQIRGVGTVGERWGATGREQVDR